MTTLLCSCFSPNVAFLSALNPPTPHFKFLETQGLSGGEVRQAIYFATAYQSVMRTSMRDPGNTDPKHILVPDRGLADYLHGLFPGSRIERLEIDWVDDAEKKPGRPRKHRSNSEKAAAQRGRDREKRLALLNDLFLLGSQDADGVISALTRTPLRRPVGSTPSSMITTEKSRRALARLPEALGVAPDVVDVAVEATRDLLAQIEREAEEDRRRAMEKGERAWRASFKPHAVIQTEHTVPTQITICGLTGGAERWLIIRFDLSKPPITFIQQVLEALPRRAPLGRNGERGVMFFGRALCFIVNYSPDEAVRCDLDGRPLEVLTKAFRPGEVTLFLGGKRVEPRVMSRILGAL